MTNDNNRELAKQPQQSRALATGTTNVRCEPATLKQGKSELGACLTLVSPSGLTADDRKEWLAVAMHTLSGIPADLLADGCAEARRRCRFPSEIVPTIMETVGPSWRRRQRWAAEDAARLANRHVARLAEPETVEAGEVAKLLETLAGKLAA